MINPFLDPKRKIYLRTGDEAYKDYLDKLKCGDGDGDGLSLSSNLDGDSLSDKIVGDGFVFDDVKFVSPDGVCFAYYKRIVIPCESMKNAQGEYFRQSWSDWHSFFNSKDDCFWFSFPLFYHALDWAWKNKNNSDGVKIKDFFKEGFSSWFALGTKFEYDKGNDSVVHKIGGKGSEVFLDTVIPRTGRRNKIRDIQSSSDWRNFLQNLIGKQDISNLADVFDWASDKESYVWTSNIKQGKRAAFAGFGGDNFIISGDSSLLSNDGRSCRVYECAKGTDSKFGGGVL